MFKWFRYNRRTFRQVLIMRYEQQVMHHKIDLIMARQEGDAARIAKATSDLKKARESLEAAVASNDH